MVSLIQDVRHAFRQLRRRPIFTYLAVALLECAIVAAASIGPALRAARVDPLVALRGND